MGLPYYAEALHLPVVLSGDIGVAPWTGLGFLMSLMALPGIPRRQRPTGSQRTVRTSASPVQFPTTTQVFCFERDPELSLAATNRQDSPGDFLYAHYVLLG